MNLDGILLGIGAVLTGIGSLVKAHRQKMVREDLEAVKRQVTPSNGVPTARMIEQILAEIRTDRAAFLGHLQDNERHN